MLFHPFCTSLPESCGTSPKPCNPKGKEIPCRYNTRDGCGCKQPSLESATRTSSSHMEPSISVRSHTAVSPLSCPTLPRNHPVPQDFRTLSHNHHERHLPYAVYRQCRVPPAFKPNRHVPTVTTELISTFIDGH